MRRSQAPSLRTTFKPVSSSSKINPSTENKSEPGKVKNAGLKFLFFLKFFYFLNVGQVPKRSTDNILSLVLSGSNIDDNQGKNDVISTPKESPESESQTTIPISVSNSENTSIKIFNVVYGKQSKKKHKTYEGDGTLEVHEKQAILKDETNKVIGTKKNFF